MTHLLYHEALTGEREAVLRFCTRYIGDSDIAEDITQQTMLAAWRHEHELKNPQARRAWLLAIARRQCLMWGRTQQRDQARFVRLDDNDTSDGQVADDYDFEHELERDDLVHLLDRAMRLLPPDARRMLVWRYVEESPQAEIAARLGLSEGAVEARLHRGKLAFKRVLANHMSEEAIAFGLLAPSDAGWQSTRIWCPCCGRQHLDAWFRPWEGKLYMRCAGCFDADIHFIHAEHASAFHGIRTQKPALGRVLDSIHALFRLRTSGAHAPCPACGVLLPIMTGVPTWVQPSFTEHESKYVWHPGCGGFDRETWHSLTWSVPEVRRFWKQHPRMRFVPARPVEKDGSPAVVTGFESLSSDARIDVVMLSETLQVVSIDGRAPGRYRDDD